MTPIIILDLEWDSAYCIKQHRFVNQIIQIGAVKLNEQLEIVDSFNEIVRSSITKKLSKRFIELTGITTEMMLGGISLTDAFLRYNRWIGSQALTMTWSTSDLYTLIENKKFLLPKGVSFRLGRYMDLQSFVQNEMRAIGLEFVSQISLSHAAELLGITFDDIDLHKAQDDCILSAKLLKRFYDPEKIKPYIRNTDDPEFYRRLTFKSYTLTNIRDDAIKPESLQFDCDQCGHRAKCVTGWKYRNGWFAANFRCSYCKRAFIGRISFKKTYDDLLIKRRIVDVKPVEKNHDKQSVQTVSEKL